MRLVKDPRPIFRQHAGVRRAFGFEFYGEICEKKMMVDDDDVALSRATPHLSDEATVIFFAFLAQTGVGASVEFVPEGARLGQFREFSAVAGLRRFLPGRDGTIVFNLFQSTQHWLVGEVNQLFAAEIIVASLHVADAQLAIAIGKQRSLQRRDILEKKLLLQVLGAG